MNKKSFWVFILALTALAGLGFRTWSQTETAFAHSLLTDIAPHPSETGKFLIASEKEVFLRGEREGWKRIFTLSENSESIKRIVAHPKMRDKIYLLLEKGVMEMDLRRGTQNWIFRERNVSKNRVYGLTLHPEDPRRLYLATERGLLQTRDGGRIWSYPTRWPEKQPIEFVGILPAHEPLFLLGTHEELFFSQKEGGFFESGFSLPLFSGRSLLEEDAEDEHELPEPRFLSLAYSLSSPLQIWVGTSEGVFESRDGGIQWDRLPDRGLEDRRILDLVFSDRSRQLVAATPRGVARFNPKENRWETLSLGITDPPSALAFQIHAQPEEILLIASGGKIFEWAAPAQEIGTPAPIFIPSPERIELFRELIRLEPTAREVQKAAIRYGDLGNGKIKRWQWASRLRAFIPDLSFGKDFSLGNNIDIDRGATNTRDEFILGPDDMDKGWDLGLNWELGDMLYSTAQTSIDSRSKLLVELRESILSQITRVYFERRRLQMEIALSAPRPTLQEHLDLILRLEELTAQLDSLTGGFFSRKLGKLEGSHPELQGLWAFALEEKE